MTDILQHNNGRHQMNRVELVLTVTDPEVIAELEKYPVGEQRSAFASSALRLGVLALRQANGLVDADVVRREGERLLTSVKELLTNHATKTVKDVSNSLRKYFDPNDGELPQRLHRLVSKDGELAQLLARHIGEDASTLSMTLEKHIGQDSALLKSLSPDQSKGVIALLKQLVETALEEHAKSILGQFSLDEKESALSRLVGELTDKNGKLREELSSDVAAVRKEFSLDNEDGALFRLVSRVEKANKTIMDEFSQDNEGSAITKMTSLLESTNEAIRASLTLDDEKSPLSRLRKELRTTIDAMSEANTKFQSEVRESLTELKTKRQEAERSTTHGLDFEDALGEFLRGEAQRLNDIYIDTTDCAGAISRCKVGDHVIQLGPESAANGSQIVFEAKGNKSYDIAKALEELQTARQNRKAQVGVIVFTREAAPDGLEVINRWGDDIIVVWDPLDTQYNVFLRAATSLARALAVANRRTTDSTAADYEKMKSAIETIVRDAEMLDDIQRFATTVKNNGEKIITKSERLRRKLDDQIEHLQKHLAAVNTGS